MKPTAESKAVDRKTLKRVIELFKPYKGDVIRTFFAVIVGVLLGIVPPFFVEIIIDQGLQKRDMGVITLYSLFTIVAVLAAAGMTLLYGYWGVVMGQKIMCDMRHKLFTHLQRMSLKFFTSTRTGEIQTRLISDVGGVQNVVSNTITDQVSNLGIAVSTLVAMFVIDWRLTLLSVVLIPLFMWLGNYVGEYAKNVRNGVQEHTGELNSTMQETLSVSGILLAKTVGQPDVIAGEFNKQNNELAKWQIKQAVVMYMFFGMIRLITQIAPTLVYWMAGWLIIQQGDASLTIGKLVAFIGLQIRFYFPLTGLMSAQVEILSSFALFARIFEYLDLPLDLTEKPDAKALAVGGSKGRVEMKNVDFDYEEGSDTLRDVSFVAEPGQLVALVGASGAGKTTLTYLIARLYDPKEGSVHIDGDDLRDLKLESIQKLVGAVTQETYLLHTSIKENLRVAKPEATDADLIEACKLAAIHDHIDSLPEKYDTVVGERGYKLSGGEKQRLAIARAILKNPQILILDEATSALDTISERLIQNSLSSLMKGRTTFAIAHRLSTILAADQILVMEKGRLVENGTHAELLAKGGVYARLYTEQFTGPEAAVSSAGPEI